MGYDKKYVMDCVKKNELFPKIIREGRNKIF